MFALAVNILCHAQSQLLTRHVREGVVNGRAQLIGQLPATQTLRFDIVLPLRDRAGLQNFLQELTELENPPSGIYLLVEHPDQEITPTLEESDVLSRWMLINRALTQSGYEVMNGYADLLAPYLGAAGATAVASGWWNTLKVFSLRKFGPSPGAARQPVQIGRASCRERV